MMTTKTWDVRLVSGGYFVYASGHGTGQTVTSHRSWEAAQKAADYFRRLCSPASQS